MKPTTFPPTLLINGKVFKAEPKEYLNHVPYINEEFQQKVKLRWSEFWKCYDVEGDTPIGKFHPYYVQVNESDISGNISFKENLFYTYLTEEQNEALGNYIREVMLETRNKEKNRI